VFPNSIFYIGLYIVIGLILAPLASHLAILRGYKGYFWYVIAFISNIFAVIGTLFNPPKPSILLSDRGISCGGRNENGPGLKKLGIMVFPPWKQVVNEWKLTRPPLTYVEVKCRLCETPHHPGASSCSSCKNTLEPLLRPESERVQSS
jgi:hypothetical protein